MVEPKTIVGLLALTTLAGIGGYAAARSRAPTAARVVAGSSAELADLRARLDKMDGLLRTNALFTSALTQRNAARGGEDTRTEPQTATPRARVETTPREPSSEELEAALRARVAGETMDPSWARTATTLASDQMRIGLPTGARIERIDCRSVLCQVDLRYTDQAGYQQHIDASFVHNPKRMWDGGFHASVGEPGPDGHVDVALFLFRRGQNPLAELFAEERGKESAAADPAARAAAEGPPGRE